MAEPDFDAALDNGLRYGWFQYCNTAEVFEGILQNQALKIDARPVQTRFEIASRLEATDAASFLKCIGLDSSDPKLVYLRNSKGKTVLHVIAHHLRLFWGRDQYGQRIQGWLDLGVSVVKNGADPSSLAERDEESWLTRGEVLEKDTGCPPPPPPPPCISPKDSHITPLLCFLLPRPYDWRVRADFKGELIFLRIWTVMMQRAGLDLCHYGAGEYEVWKSLGVGDLSWHLDIVSNSLRLSEVLYGATPEEWSFGVCHTWSISLYELQQPPGAFPKRPVVPATIAWSPTWTESDEGPWTLIDEKRHKTNNRDIRDLITYSTEPFSDLVDACQDDAGVIMLMEHRASRGQSTSTRSYSQPPSLRRRELAYYAAQYSQKHRWLPCYHLCPGAPSWRFGCVDQKHSGESYEGYSLLGDGITRNVFHLRSCVKGIHSGCLSIQQSWQWEIYSFLADLAECQDDAACTGRASSHRDDCPWPEGCRDFHVEQLNVPEDLRYYHPRRRWFSDDDDDGDNSGSAGS
jgi:hypothetical protein